MLPRPLVVGLQPHSRRLTSPNTLLLLSTSPSRRSTSSTSLYLETIMPKDPKPKAAKGDGPAKKGKADKDPNAPKRPLSAYMIFSQDQREKVKADNPDATFGQLGKLLGGIWKEMDDEDKKPYTDKAEKAKEDYAVAKADYEKTGKKPAAAAEDDDE